jgi:prepilin peptidase CpaA
MALPLDILVFGAAPFLFALGPIYDALTYKIPNWISAALILLFVPAALLSGLTWGAAGMHLLTFATALVFGMALFAFALIGAGDAKFFAAAALWIGPGDMLAYMLIFALAGGVVALGLLVLRRVPAPAFAMRYAFARGLWNPQNKVPYGIALGLGALIVLPGTPLAAAALAG